MRSNFGLEYFVKDLSMFTNVPRADILMVDNFIYSFSLDIPNGVPIKPYYKGKDDYELEYLMEKLMMVKHEPESSTLVDLVNKTLRLDEFWSFLGAKDEDDNELRPKIARKSVVIGQTLNSPQVTKVAAQPSPSRSHYGGRASSPALSARRLNNVSQGATTYSSAGLQQSMPRIYSNYTSAGLLQSNNSRVIRDSS